jgi:5-formyltetrahydrofolate cyclo-ligase
MKKELRQSLRTLMAAIPPDELHVRSARACALLAEQREYRDARTIMIYLSLPTEVDTSPLALQAWTEYKRVVAPRVEWEQKRMLPIEIHSLVSGLEAGEFGIRQPVDGRIVSIGEIDLAIVPGLAFDEQGNRLGRGRGFYDRFLSHRDFRGVACALAVEEQVVASVPHDENDVTVDLLVTEQRVRRFGRGDRT